jgi:membrane associated rhomboid family serine protease
MTQVPPPTPQPVVPVCYRHPKRETYVRCTRCNRPICPECMNEASVGHQCPECVAEGRRGSRTTRTVFGGTMAGAKGYVTYTLIAINVLVQVVSSLTAGGRGLFGGGYGGLLGGITPLLIDGGVIGQVPYDAQGHVLGPYGVANGEYYRLVTSMFLHYGALHLLMNMWALWILGRSLEGALGPTRFLTLYLVSGLGGGVASYLFSPDSLGAGASGAIFGLFAALFVVLRRLGRDVTTLIPLLVINIAISFAPGISFTAHAGGFIIGGIVAFVLAYAPRKNRNLVVSGAIAGLLVIMLIAVVMQTAALQAIVPA